MKKITIVIVLVLSIFITGCSVVRIDTTNIDNIVHVILPKQNKLFNRVCKGYKYYIPRGVSYTDSNELNELLSSKNNDYFLYIDAVSYYKNISHEYKENKDAYYSRIIDIDGSMGYIEINEQNGLYLIEYMYNYAKIESLVHKKDIENVILDSSYILSTVKFNKEIIKIMLDDDLLSNKEEQYDIFTPNKEKEKENILEVLR